MALELYPLVTDDGKWIPLDVARATESIAVASGTAPTDILTVGSLISVYSPKLLRVAIFNGAAPSLDVLDTSVANSFYLPPGAIAQFETEGTGVSVLSLDGSATYLYITILETWRSTAREQALNNG